MKQIRILRAGTRQWTRVCPQQVHGHAHVHVHVTSYMDMSMCINIVHVVHAHEHRPCCPCAWTCPCYMDMDLDLGHSSKHTPGEQGAPTKFTQRCRIQAARSPCRHPAMPCLLRALPSEREGAVEHSVFSPGGSPRAAGAARPRSDQCSRGCTAWTARRRRPTQ